MDTQVMHVLVSGAGGDVPAEGQRASQQAVQDHPGTPHVHLAAVVATRFYRCYREMEMENNRVKLSAQRQRVFSAVLHGNWKNLHCGFMIQHKN